MRAYLLTTAILFVLIAAAHIWEVVGRARFNGWDFMVIGLGVGLAAWAWWLLSRERQPGGEGR